MHPSLTDRNTAPSWKFNLGFIVVLTIATGMVADIFIYSTGEKERIFLSPKIFAISGLFTTTFFLSFKGTEMVLKRFVALNSIRNIWIYIGVTAVAMAATFFIAGWMIDAAFPEWELFTIGTPVFNVTAGVAFLGCMTILITYYGRDFYLRYMAMEKAQHGSQMAALKAQINPHFLFNSLNSIAALIRVNPQKAEMVIEDLSDLFRYSLQSSKTDRTPLREEIHAMETYLAIEKARFGDRLQVAIDIGEDIADTMVPGLILQPLVENSVKHGASQTLDVFRIDLSIRKKGKKIEIAVTDNGPGFGNRPMEEILRNGTGLSNIRDRLELMYGGQATFSVAGQTVRLGIPG